MGIATCWHIHPTSRWYVEFDEHEIDDIGGNHSRRRGPRLRRRVRLQRYAGLSYVEANVQSLWRSGIKTKSIAEKADRTEKGVWRINARAEMKIEESGYRVDGDLLTWLSQNSSYFTYTPRRDPLFGNISEPYCRYSR